MRRVGVFGGQKETEGTKSHGSLDSSLLLGIRDLDPVLSSPIAKTPKEQIGEMLCSCQFEPSDDGIPTHQCSHARFGSSCHVLLLSIADEPSGHRFPAWPGRP